MFVVPKLTGGLGNRLFQVAAALQYAERHGCSPIFVRTIGSPNPHDDANTLFTLFPSIPIVETLEDIPLPTGTERTTMILKETTTPPPTTPITLLQGYFQNPSFLPEHFFPAFPQPDPACVELANTAFLHIRRGDYLKLKHHNVPLERYIASAIGRIPSDIPITVFSDDLPWCKRNLVRVFPTVDYNRWRWCPEGLKDVECLLLMSCCKKGAIVANSTFSWWGAYFGPRIVGSPCFFPDTWHTDRRPCALNPPWGKVLRV